MAESIESQFRRYLRENKTRKRPRHKKADYDFLLSSADFGELYHAKKNEGDIVA